MTDSKDEKVDGAKIAAQILMRMPPKSQERIVQAMEENAPQVLKKVQEKMVTLDHLAELTPQSIQILLKEIDHKDVIVALNVASTKVKEAVYQSIPARKRAIIEDDLKHSGDISAVEVAGAQKRIVVKIDELREQGKIRTEDKKGLWA